MQTDELQQVVDGLATQLGRSAAIDDPRLRLRAVSRHFGDEDTMRVRAVTEFTPRRHRGPLLGGLVVMWIAGAAVAYVVGEILLTVGDDGRRWMLASADRPRHALGQFAAAPGEVVSTGSGSEADALAVFGAVLPHPDPGRVQVTPRPPSIPPCWRPVGRRTAATAPPSPTCPSTPAHEKRRGEA